MCPSSTADTAVLDDVSRAVAAARATGLAYADDDWSPVSDISLELLAKLARIDIHKLALPETILELVAPETAGRFPLVLNRTHDWGAKRFALRHGIGHVLAHHVDEVAFLAAGDDFMAHEERVADVFALVDAIPDRQLYELRQAGYSAVEIERWVYAEIGRWTSGWEPERIRDRTTLRLAAGRQQQ